MATNELGFGSLASVAWTDMNGTGLTATQLTAVNTDIKTAEDIAEKLINVIKNAVARGDTSFSLFQAYVSNSTDQAAFVSEITGEDISTTRQLSLNQWRAVAAQLQDHAAQQASRRSPSGESGGIKTVNGNWYVNGQELSLLDAYMALRVNQVANFDDSLNIYIAELNDNNREVKSANDWLNTLRSRRTATAAPSSDDRKTFSSKWGYDPVAKFHPSDKPLTDITGPPIAYSPLLGDTKSIDGYIENVRGYVDSKDSANQTVQQKLEQMTNRRSEVLDGLTSFAKAQTQTGSSFARNLG